MSTAAAVHRVPVLVAGGGPVGLTLGHELAAHGVSCLVVERNPSTTRHPKMDITNSRSMELFGRLGLSELIRSIGVPADHPFDVIWVTRPTGTVLHRFAYPSQNAAWERIRACEDGSAPAEPPVRISQIVLEPALRDALVARPGVTLRYGWALRSFVQDADGVTATLVAEDGTEQTVRADYLVGCDGGGSTVRHQLGIGLDGTPAIRQSYTVHFRSRDHARLQRFGHVWHVQSAMGTLVAQDDDEAWTLHSRVPDGVDPDTLDPRAVLEDFLGGPVEAEILVANPWKAHLLVADRYGEGRVLLCGDATHQFVPTGGYGMNTGVADACDLGWKLWATLAGWGGPALLGSYEAERRPVALTNREGSRAHVLTRFRIAELYAAQPNLHDEGLLGEKARATLAAQLDEIGNAENECWGIEYGYRYDDSPIVALDAEPPPPVDPRRYVPSTRPGGRLPNTFVDGVSLYRRLGEGFTLLAVGAEPPAMAIERAAARGMPLTVLELPTELRPIYPEPYLLVRPDHHLAWRGGTDGTDWDAVLARATGWAG